MDIKFLPRDTKCLVDANILIYHLNGASLECRDFLTRVENGEVKAYLTTVVIAEILHRQMLIEAVSKGLVTSGKILQKLKKQPDIIGKLTDYISAVEKILTLPFQILRIDDQDIVQSHQIRNKDHLFVNDSINLACAIRNNITDVISRDEDFTRVTGVKVWSPTDI